MAVDAGCGPGRHATVLAAVAQRVIAVDISRNMLNQARRQQPSSTRAVVDFVQADVRRLPLKDRTADCVVNFEVLEHLPDGKEGVLAALRSFRRVLRDYGMLITEVPLSFHTLMDFAAPPSLKEIVGSARRNYYKEAPLTVGNAFRRALLEKLLKVAGFTVVSRRFVRVLPSGIIERLPGMIKVDGLLERVPLLKRAARQVVWLAEVA